MKKNTPDYMDLAVRDSVPREQVYSMCREEAERGNLLAQFNLASMYSKGFGVIRNHQTAFKWYRLSAKQGHTAAQLALGIKYFHGEGTKKDLVLSYTWLRIAENNGQAGASKIQGTVSRMMTQSQINKARNLAEAADENGYLDV